VTEGHAANSAPSPQGGPAGGSGKKRRGMLAFYVAMGFLMVTALAGYFAWTPLRVHYYSSEFNGFRSNQCYYARRLIECGPEGTRRFLQLVKTGSYDADVGQVAAVLLTKYADHDVLPQVSELFADPDPRARAFAAGVAGHLRDQRYLGGLQALAADDSALPDSWFDKSVAARAKLAIKMITNKESPQQVANKRELEQEICAMASGPARLRGMTKRK
jgi:hypothetical protein